MTDEIDKMKNKRYFVYTPFSGMIIRKEESKTDNKCQFYFQNRQIL